ncbi:MAG: SRPBCC family protein [Tepidisphaeraceae bacterium]
MTTINAVEQSIQTLEVRKDVQIAAPVEITFQAILDELGPEGQMPDGKAFPMKIEPWPGGRWYRDLGNNTGHFWGHVQVIKPPALLEICGPLFMSYPAISHVQYRLAPEGDGTRLKLVHRAMGQITEEHSKGVHQGWDAGIERIRELADRRKNASRMGR